MKVRPPRDGCPACGAEVAEAVVSESTRGRCVVLWPCRHVLPIDPNHPDYREEWKP